MNELLQLAPRQKTSRMLQAKIAVLDNLEAERDSIEFDKLDQEIADQFNLTAGTVIQIRKQLTAAGLICSVSKKTTPENPKVDRQTYAPGTSERTQEHLQD